MAMGRFHWTLVLVDLALGEEAAETRDRKTGTCDMDSGPVLRKEGIEWGGLFEGP